MENVEKKPLHVLNMMRNILIIFHLLIKLIGADKTDWCGEHPGFNEWIESQKEKEPSIDFRRVKCPECDSIDIVYGWDVLSQTTCHCRQCGRHFNLTNKKGDPK
jgi:ribosomal protein S27E